MKDSGSAPAQPPSSLQTTLTVLCLLLVFVFACLFFIDATSDDAYITMRYARNAAAGEGIVYNPGERVEGYSNPLWLGLLVVAATIVTLVVYVVPHSLRGSELDYRAIERGVPPEAAVATG